MTQSIDRRVLLAGGLAMATGPSRAQTEPPSAAPAAVAPPAAAAPPTPAPRGPPPPPAPGSGVVRVALKTSKGVITLDINQGKAPITAGNFLRYVDLRAYDGESFYRAAQVKGAPQLGTIEAGIHSSAAKLLKPIAHESTTRTGLSHTDGAISMGRRAPGTATSDFFICIGDQTFFDADPAAKGDNLGFAAFGHVVDGMDVVRAILASPTSATAGVGVMKGQMLKPPIPILSARRVAAKKG